MGTRQGMSAGITHAITASVPNRSRPKDVNDDTLLPKVLSNTAVSLVNRWITRPSGVTSKKDSRVDRVARKSARWSLFAATKLASAHMNVLAHDTAACPMPMPAYIAR